MASKSVGTSQLDHNEAYTTRVAKILKDWENPRASEDVGQLEVSYAAVAGGVWTGTITSEDRQDCTEGCAYVHILGPRNSIPEHTPAQMRQNTGIRTFIAVLFTITQLDQLKCQV